MVLIMNSSIISLTFHVLLLEKVFCTILGTKYVYIFTVENIEFYTVLLLGRVKRASS